VEEDWIERTQEERKPEEREEVHEVEGISSGGEGELSDQLLSVVFEHRACVVFAEELDHPHLAGDECRDARQ